MPSDSTETPTPPTSTLPSPNRLGKARLLKPQIQPAALLMRMNSPSVRITSVSVSPPSTGRMITRSISAPIRNASASVARNASPIGSPASTRPHARNVVNMAISPWAKFTIPVVRKISTSASASAPYREPMAMPSTTVSMNSVTAQTPR